MAEVIPPATKAVRASVYSSSFYFNDMEISRCHGGREETRDFTSQ
jgi:hypothetical protein